MKILEFIRTNIVLIQTAIVVVCCIVIYNEIIVTKKENVKQREELIMVKDNLAKMYTYNKEALAKSDIQNKEMKKQYDELKGQYKLISTTLAGIQYSVNNIPVEANSTVDTLTFTKGDYFKFTSKYTIDKVNETYMITPFDSQIDYLKLNFKVESQTYEDDNQTGQYVVLFNMEETNFNGLVKIDKFQTKVSIPHKKPLKYLVGVNYQENGINFLAGARIFGVTIFNKDFNVLGVIGVGKQGPLTSAGLILQF